MEQPSYSSKEEIKTIYQELCISYRSIEDFRAKLLGLLPFVTASSFVATIVSNPARSAQLANLVLPFGVLGAMVTLSLFFYEIENIKRAALLAERGRALENSMHIVGTFAPAPYSVFNKQNAASLIYSTTFAGWICLALWFVLPGLAILITLAVFLLSALLSMPTLKQVQLRLGTALS